MILSLIVRDVVFCVLIFTAVMLLPACVPQPNGKVDSDRTKAMAYVRALMKKCLAAQVFLIGPSASRTYFASDPLDVSAFLCVGQEKVWFLKVSEALFQAVAEAGNLFDSCDSDSDRSSGRGRANTDRSLSSLMSGSPSPGPHHSSFGEAVQDDHEFLLSSCRIDAVRYSAATRGTICCEVDGVPISIGANRLSDLYHSALVECTSVIVGKHHLFKRSLILIQARTRLAPLICESSVTV
jgi:hypothetical protein